ncbi:hypothetical protein CEB3_c27040 [Peptococcaceae bacterium CEB3]|nr:hypothetical protein CEB3_c27040 [Peptococcaceae bacterium CEB3]
MDRPLCPPAQRSLFVIWPRFNKDNLALINIDTVSSSKIRAKHQIKLEF